MHTDLTFEHLVEDVLILRKELHEIQLRPDYDFNTFQKIANLESGESTEKEKLLEMENILGKESVDKIQQLSSSIKLSITNLNTKYEKIDNLPLENEILKLLERRKDLVSFEGAQIPVESISEVNVSLGGGCSYRYYVCMAGVLALAIGCHSACVATTIAAPICVILCAAYQIDASLDCQKNHCEEEKKETIQ